MNQSTYDTSLKPAHRAANSKLSPSQASTPISTPEAVLEAWHISKRFGELQALDDVSIRLRSGSVHALLGENGAGKSTLVKCIMGYYQPDSGQMTLAGKEHLMQNPRAATRDGIGMVYQHFTLIDNMTVAENIVVARPDLPFAVDWTKEATAIQAKMEHMPFQLDCQRKVSGLATGEKQKLEIVKQLLLDTKVLILDEPTSVLTPVEADEVLGEIRKLAVEQGLSVLMITHKFREVMHYADEVTVLRKGKLVGSVNVADTCPEALAEMMMGTRLEIRPQPRVEITGAKPAKLSLHQVSVENDQGLLAVNGIDLCVGEREILGIAGVSGNGQAELVAALSGQRSLAGGAIRVDGEQYVPTRKQIAKHRVYCLPEEPLRNACVPELSLALNLSLRNYDSPETAWFRKIMRFGVIRRRVKKLIERFNIKTTGPNEPIGSLSGGNVQRAVLARELSEEVNVLVVANPCFGLDFKAVRAIRNQIMEARNKGAAVLLISEDLDEIMELSDRFLVISKGKILHESRPLEADIIEIGQAMAGQGQTMSSAKPTEECAAWQSA